MTGYPRRAFWSLMLAATLITDSDHSVVQAACSSTLTTTDFDWNGTGEYLSTVGSCWWPDPQTGEQHFENYSSEKFLGGVSAWGPQIPGSPGLGEPFGFARPDGFVPLAGLGASLVGFSLEMLDGSVRFGWRRRWSVGGGPQAWQFTTVELADRTNEPVTLGVPPGSRWTPSVTGDGYSVPPVTEADRAAGILRRLGYGQRYFGGGVTALTVGHDQRLWGIGREVLYDDKPRGRTRFTDVLFSMRQDGGDYREAEVLISSTLFWTFEISSVPEGFIYITSGDHSGPVYQYEIATDTLKNLRGGALNAALRSRLQILSDGRLCGSYAGGLFRMNQDGRQVERLSLQVTGITNFNRGVVESPEGWLYVLGQAGGAGNRGGIVRCRPDGTDASRWFEFGTAPTGGSGSREKSAVTLGRNGNLYGYVDPDLAALYGINPAGELVWTGSRTAYSLCQPDSSNGGGICYEFGALGPVMGALMEGPEGYLYGLVPGAVFRVSMLPSNPGQWSRTLEPVAQTSSLEFSGVAGNQQVWTRSDTGTLFMPVKTGVCSFTPGMHGAEPVRTFGPAGSDGASPVGPLVRDGHGLVFGIAADGGVLNEGAVFTAREDGGAGSILHSFTGSSGDVLKPSAFLVLADDGWLYGTSKQGERYDFVPRLYRLHPETGAFEVLASLPGRYSGVGQTYCGLVRARDGTLLGTTPRGGAANLGTVFRYSTVERRLAVLHEFGSAEDERGQAWPEILDGSDGYLYGLVSSTATNLPGSDGLFRMFPDGSGFRMVSRLVRPGPSLKINGGLTETRDGHLYMVRALQADATTNDAYLGDIVRFVPTGFAEEPWRAEVVFRNPVDEEPFLRPGGRIVEMPDGLLVGLGTQWQTAAYQLDPGTGQLERTARAGYLELAGEPGNVAPFSVPVPVGDRFLVGFSGYPTAHIRRVNLARPNPPVARDPVVITYPYGKRVSFSLDPVLFEGAHPPFEVRGLPPGFDLQAATYGTLSGVGAPVGRHVIEVFGGDNFWPVRRATNTVTLVVEPVPLILSALPRIVPVGASDISVQGTVQPPVESDGIFHAYPVGTLRCFPGLGSPC